VPIDEIQDRINLVLFGKWLVNIFLKKKLLKVLQHLG
jgi:hypothetical protein